jgi:pimeloyl-ACP methyl ester carboxylesterase
MGAEQTVSRFARNGPVTIAYQDRGGEGGEPLLLVNGLGGVRYHAGMIGAFIGAGFHVATYDHRDSGESTFFTDTEGVHPVVALFRRRPAVYTGEDMTDDAIAVLDALGWDSAHVYGHSMGGLITQRMALRHPARVRSLTVSAALPSDAGKLATLRYLRAAFIRRTSQMRFPNSPEGDKERALALAKLIASPGYPFDENAARASIADADVTGIGDPKAQSRQIGAHWKGPKLSELQAPTLVLIGDADQVMKPKAARDLADAVPGAKLVILPGVGHDLPAPLWPELAELVRTNAKRWAPARKSSSTGRRREGCSGA